MPRRLRRKPGVVITFVRQGTRPVRFGSLADIPASNIDVRFTPKSGHSFTKAWLQSVAPDARVAARCNSMTALLSATKSGVGLAALPMTIGDNDPGLVRVLRPIPGLTTNLYLLMHQDMKTTPRVRALFDFFIEELNIVRPVLAGESSALMANAQSK